MPLFFEAVRALVMHQERKQGTGTGTFISHGRFRCTSLFRGNRSWNSRIELRWTPGASVCVVASSAGYPGSYKTGLPISGLAAAGQVPGVQVFHAGTVQTDGHILTAGGRVLGVSAAAESLPEALARAYQALDEISFDGIYFRRDIAHRALQRKRS